ncbi:Biphenyl-2,3-diol 1,2-dioxygenase 2 [Pseudocercospora fuligena]|uniref:Biphenyl-2,3-diol 1,2-dioxygenase 2 n=1 Tax=Pseudocercospora fuligena TaxID=685502 RepID=A0A8H6VBC3_9PEZI|nr:Biphenyl-2,3-diol 1,2-dioxygenase 2 [Pseudocercospora fuligena]
MAMNGNSQKVISPSKLAHIVLRTNNFAKMKWYYETFFGGHSVYANEGMAFITYDDEHHRIALLSNPSLGNNTGSTSGLEHIAFTFDSLEDLCTAYKQRKALGITPGWCVNHGPTTSMYYKDPDGNQIETQFDNFETAEEATAMMQTPAFHENALGADFDPEGFVAESRLVRVLVTSIAKRQDVGPRDLDDLGALREEMNASQTGPTVGTSA